MLADVEKIRRLMSAVCRYVVDHGVGCNGQMMVCYDACASLDMDFCSKELGHAVKFATLIQ